MHTELTRETHPSLAHLEYPGFLKRSVEFFFTGSVRLQLLQTLNAHESSSWRVLSGPQLGFDVRNTLCGAAFLFHSPGQLSSIHITSAQGTISLKGDCSLAQHLLDAATQSCAKLLYESKQLAVAEMVQEAGGETGVQTTYEATDGYDRNPPDGWEWWTRRNATLVIPAGRVALSYSKFTCRLSSDAYHERLETSRYLAETNRADNVDIMSELQKSLPYSFTSPIKDTSLSERVTISVPARQETTIQRSAALSNAYTAVARILANPDLSGEMHIGEDIFDSALAMAAKAQRKSTRDAA